MPYLRIINSETTGAAAFTVQSITDPIRGGSPLTPHAGAAQGVWARAQQVQQTERLFLPWLVTTTDHLPSCLSYNTLHTWTSSFRWYGLLKNSSFYFLAFWSNLARARIRWAKLLFVISLMAAPSSHLHSLTHQQISGARCPLCAKPLGSSSRPLSPSVLWTPTPPRKLLLPSASSSSQLAPHFKAPSRGLISPQTTVQLYTSVRCPGQTHKASLEATTQLSMFLLVHH